MDAADPPIAPSARPLILLVEDHLDTRLMYAEFLGLTYEVRTAGTAHQALELMTTCRPEIVITDVALPGMTGLELVERVRQDPELRDVPIICLSGFDGASFAARAREAGCTRLLQKPCLPDALLEAVDELLVGRQGRSRAVL